MKTWMQTLLSQRTFVRIEVDGPLDAAEYRQLMRVLAAIGGMFESETPYATVLRDAIETANAAGPADHTTS